jgi:sterol desaturase/sphingolipid hydroxylase (fatty acid hydroxylase superfamily)
MITKIIIIYFICILFLEYHIPHNKLRNIKIDFLNSTIGAINKIIFFIIIPINLNDFMVTNIVDHFKLSSLPYHILISILLLDFAIYWQHRFFHMNNKLFKLHALHHTDRQLTSTSAFRFHIFELILSFIYKHLFVFLLGIPYLDYIYYEVILLMFAIFNHSNIEIPHAIEKYLKIIFITPKTHRSHHDLSPISQNRNFGNIFTFWDKIFLSYEYKETYKYGIKHFANEPKLLNLLKTPFKFK